MVEAYAQIFTASSFFSVISLFAISHYTSLWTVNSAFPLLSVLVFLSFIITLFGWAAAIFKGKPLPGSLIEGSKYSYPPFFICYPLLSSFPVPFHPFIPLFSHAFLPRDPFYVWEQSLVLSKLLSLLEIKTCQLFYFSFCHWSKQSYNVAKLESAASHNPF